MEIWSYSCKTDERITKYQKQVLTIMLQKKDFLSEEEICGVAMTLSTSKERIERWMSEIRKKKTPEGTLLEGEQISSVKHTNSNKVCSFP